MRLNDLAADGQPHARSISLGGEKRLEDALRANVRKPNPGIAHGNKQLTILCPRRGNAQFAALPLHGRLRSPNWQAAEFAASVETDPSETSPSNR